MRPSFLDNVSAAKASGCAGRRCISGVVQTCGRTGTIGHTMSRDYVLEYPVDDPDEDDDDDIDEDDEDDDDEDADEEETETWQVSRWDGSAKGWSLLDFRD
jgi:cobalamin biosynthesis protein CobT